jgi:hypothetical protein
MSIAYAVGTSLMMPIATQRLVEYISMVTSESNKYFFSLPTSNILCIYEIILKPIWTYGMQLWGTASTCNIEILERFQSKALHMIVDAAPVRAECGYPN